MPTAIPHEPEIWAKIISWRNLHAAWVSAALGKRSKPEVAHFELQLERHLLHLQTQLSNGHWQPQGYTSFEIHDPKRRLVSAAPFADRVVHHALVRCIEPVFEAQFIPHSYANRIGMGTHRAITQAQLWQKEHAFVLQCDLRQFFPSVDHAILMRCLRKSIICPQTLTLCQKIVDSGIGLLEHEYTPIAFPGDDLLSAQRPRGLPIGNLTSQFWANALLHELDNFITTSLGCTAYLRYVDDFLLFSNSKKQLWRWKTQIRELLQSLRLSMHERSSTVYPTHTGIPFLGMRLLPDQLRLKTRNARAFEARLRGMQQAVGRGQMSLQEVSERIAGWTAHANQADTWALRQRIFQKFSFTPPKKEGCPE